MRINGEWLRGDDEVLRPIVAGLVRLNEGTWTEVAFLLDGGADRTVFSSAFLDLLKPSEISDAILLAGVGGEADSITVQTVIGFPRENGKMVRVNGQFAAFTQTESTDLSVLGRDVTNNFAVIYDYPDKVVTLLGPPHRYEIKGIPNSKPCSFFVYRSLTSESPSSAEND